MKGCVNAETRKGPFYKTFAGVVPTDPRVATVLVGGLVLALTFVMQYVQGADDLFNLSNKIFGVFLPPIAVPMLGGLLVRRLSRRAGMAGLVGGIAFGLTLFSVGARWPFLREMVWSFSLTAAATVACLQADERVLGLLSEIK